MPLLLCACPIPQPPEKVCLKKEEPTASQPRTLCVACGNLCMHKAWLCAHCTKRADADSCLNEKDIEQVVTFHRQLGITDLSVDALTFSLAVTETETALVWARSRGRIGELTCRFRGADDLRRVLTLWMSDDLMERFLAHWEGWSVDYLYKKLNKCGFGPLIGFFSGLYAQMCEAGSSRYSYIAETGERLRSVADEPLFRKILARQLTVNLTDRLGPKSLGSASLESFKRPFVRIVNKINIRRGLPRLLGKLILCHELTHAALWLRQPYRCSGVHQVEEILCHAVMLLFIDWLKQKRLHTSEAELILINRRSYIARQEADTIVPGLLDSWLGSLQQLGWASTVSKFYQITGAFKIAPVMQHRNPHAFSRLPPAQ